jgi:competence protein ComEC
VTGFRSDEAESPGVDVGSTGAAGLRPAVPPSLAGVRLRVGEAARALADGLADDLALGLGFPFLVVAFAFGIALCFTVPGEPWWPATVAVAATAISATVVLRRWGRAAHGLAVVAALLAGFAAAAVETARVDAPRLDHERSVRVTGRVTDVDATAHGGTRLTVAVAAMEAPGLAAASTPRLIAATLTARGPAPAVGDPIAFRARLKPPEGPVLPGGYDFARRAHFEGRGASGYVLGRVGPADLGPPPLLDRLMAPIGVLRHTIAERVRATLPGAAGAIGAAIMVGEQRAIPDAANDALRTSGLTHIVSISGLHMSLVAGGVIAVVRLLLALIPAIALRFPIRKWAAAAAIVAATVYLLLSGNQVAALRSHLMLSVALLAVIFDRPALTMHTIAVSALAILVVDPSAALEPSFQMSYLAVIALVASWDLWRLWLERRPPPAKEAGLPTRAIAAGVLYVQGLAFSSLIAGLATAPVIAGIFYRGAPYSILANMIVLPVTGVLIMPAAVVAALAMPFGLDPWPLRLMGLGIDFMVAVGAWVAGLPGGTGLVGAPHPAMMPIGIAAVLWLSVPKSRIRLLGIVPAVAAAVLVGLGPRPDVLVGRHGSPVAVRDLDGRLHVLATRQDRFDTAIWLAADADPRLPGDPSLAEGWRCDPLGCVFRRAATPRSEAVDPTEATDDLVVAVVRHPRAFDEDCRRAMLVVSALVAPTDCRERTTVVDRLDLATDGATTLRFAGPVRFVGPPALAPPRQTTSPRAVDPTEDEAIEPMPSTAAAPTSGARPVADGRPPAEAVATAPSADRVGASQTTRSADPRPPDGDARDGTSDDPLEAPVATVDLIRRTSLPSPPRAWTPVDPILAARRSAAPAAEAAADPAQ